MATKKFAQMSTKKLNALLETASEEDAVAIKAILESRNAQQNLTVEPSEGTELSEEEKQAIAAAEKAAAPKEAEPANEEKKKGGRKASPKLSEEELLEAEKQAKENVGHRCSVILPGTAIRVDGTILTTLKDKRAMQVYYQVETDAIDDMESRKIYKKFGSEDITVLDEVVELKKKTESKARVAKAKMDAGEWEAEAEAIKEVAGANIGKTVQLDENTTGRIVSLLNDKRSGGMYYRIEFEDELGVKKVCHKVINYTKAEDGTITLAELEGMAAELDEKGQEMNQAFQERKAREPRKTLTPEEKVLAAEEALKKAEASLQKAQETLEARKTALATAKAELAAKHDAQAEAAGEGAGEEELA
jgi:hypothetical protein